MAILLASAAVGLAACGGDDGGGSDGGSNDAAAAAQSDDFEPTHEAPSGAEQGGTLTVLASDGSGVLDPGVVYHQFGYMVSYPIHRTLMAWPPDETEMPVPDLAAEEPEIADDGRTVTFTIREGVNFAPPVDREVVAADFEYAIERGLMPGVANGYVSTYLGSLVGFEEATEAAEAEPTQAPDIEGISTPDDRTLVLEFTEPVGLGAVQALSLPLGAPVPEEYAAELDAAEQSEYGQHMVGTGPYMVENDEEGNLTGYVPGERIDLVRNPNWDEETDFRPAYLDAIEVRLGFEDPGPTARRIVDAEATVSGDVAMDPEALRFVVTEHPETLSLAPIGAIRYVTINTRLEPFDDINVRRALLAATDREALRLARGGELVGPIASHFIPPQIPGFEEAGGYDGPDLDFLADPSGDPELAAEYMRQAGFESGEYEGDAEVLMVGVDGPVERRTGQVVLETLEELGFDVTYRTVTADAMYTRFCTVPDRDIAICPNVSWFKDFNDARSILEPTFSGEAIQPENNTNISELDVPAINDAIEEARTTRDPDERAEAWGEVDRMVTAQAPAIPWVWDHEPVIASPDVENVVSAFTGKSALSWTSLSSP